MDPVQFVKALSKLNFNNAFNPYSNRCIVHDLDDAPQRRLKTLLTVLEAATKRDIDSIWIGRDLGYRGGRRTGLALTDDAHMHRICCTMGIIYSEANERRGDRRTNCCCHLARSFTNRRIHFSLECLPATPSRTR